MVEDSDSTYIAGYSGVQLNLFNKWGVMRKGVTSGHEVLVGLLVPVLREAKTTWWNFNLNRNTNTEKKTNSKPHRVNS